MNIKCIFGHKKYIQKTFIPSIDADILEEYSITVKRKTCGKTLSKIHEKWCEEKQEFQSIE